jgi:hypothetical protein
VRTAANQYASKIRACSCPKIVGSV